MNIIGIIGAMDEEVQILIDRMELIENHNVASLQFYVGKLKSKRVVIVKSGIGKVNAAICTQILIDKFSVDSIINTGVAGAIDKKIDIGDIVVSSDVVEHDFDVTHFEGYKLGQIPRMKDYVFKADSKLVEISLNAGEKENKGHNTYKGRVLSGDIFVSSTEKKDFLSQEFNGYCAEMEGAAIGHTCYLNNIPFVVIRAISDSADGNAVDNYKEFVMNVVEHSSNMICDILESF